MENRVEELRKEKCMSQEEFAKAIQVSRQTVSSIETEKYNLSLELAFVIADFFQQNYWRYICPERRINNEKK